MSDQSAIYWAQQELGDEYVFGAEDAAGNQFDCSGLVQYAYRKAGFALPRTADQQYRATQRISAKDAVPGDLIYYLDGNGHAYHTGIYMGNGKFLESPETGQVVKIANFNVNHVVFGRVKGYQAKFGQEAAAQLANNPDPYISYGYVQDLASAVPDIAKILKQATKEHWSPQHFTDMIQNTKWWKTNSDSAKQMLALEKADPAEYKQRMAAAQAHVKQIAAAMGVTLDAKQMKAQAVADLYQGLDDTTLTQNIGAMYNGLPQSGGGSSVAMAQQIKQLAASYGLPVTQKWIDDHIRQSLSTGVGIEAATQDLINQAKSAYPTLGKLIDSGQTVAQIAQPFIAQMAQTLEIDPSQINLNDPTIQRALLGQQQVSNPAMPQHVETFRAPSPGAPKKGPSGGGGTAANTSTDAQPMTLYDFQKQLKNDPRWGYTDNARQTAYSLVHSLGQAWGFAS